jgi:hypothetical protein
VALERVTRIELAFSAWEADVLPLNYTRDTRERVIVPGAGATGETGCGEGGTGVRSVPACARRTRGIITAVSGLAVLALNVIDAADRGASGWNFASIAVGAFLLFYGFTVVARTGRPS